MTRMFYPPELDYSRQRDSFDPIREGERYGLLPELSLAIWKRVSEDATDSSGRRNEDQALEQFRELAARIAARGRQLRPDPGRLTRVGTEIHGEWAGTWAADELLPRVPGRQTLVAVEARRWANRAGDASATMASNSSGSVPRNVDEEMARRGSSATSEVAQVMAKLRAWGPGGSDVLPASTPIRPAPRAGHRLTTNELPAGAVAQSSPLAGQTPAGKRPSLKLGLEQYHEIALQQVLLQMFCAAGAFDSDPPSGKEPLAHEPAREVTGGAASRAATVWSQLSAALERTFGPDAGFVEILRDHPAPAGAEAFTTDQRVHVAPGYFDADSESGRVRLGHEVAHALQQRRGGDRRTRISASERAALETEAELAGHAFAAGRPFEVRGHAPAAVPLYRGNAPVADEPTAPPNHAVPDAEALEILVAEMKRIGPDEARRRLAQADAKGRSMLIEAIRRAFPDQAEQIINEERKNAPSLTAPKVQASQQQSVSSGQNPTGQGRGTSQSGAQQQGAEQTAGGNTQTQDGGSSSKESGTVPALTNASPGQAGAGPQQLSDLSTEDLALISMELVEHQRWAGAMKEVGAAGSVERAGFIAEEAGRGAIHGAAEGFAMGFAMGAVGKLAQKFVPVPGVGAILGGAMAAYSLATRNWGATAATIGKFGKGADTYETIANTIAALSEIIDVITQVLNVIAGIIGVISAVMWLVTILTVGIAAPLAATLSAIALGIGAATSVADGINNLVLQPCVLLFRALHTFNSQADPSVVEAEGAGISDAAQRATGMLGGLVGAKGGEAAAEGGVNRIQARIDAKARGAGPQEAQTTTQEAQATPQEGQATPKEGQATTPKEGQATPKEGQATPKEGQATPKEGQATPQQQGTKVTDSPLSKTGETYEVGRWTKTRKGKQRTYREIERRGPNGEVVEIRQETLGKDGRWRESGSSSVKKGIEGENASRRMTEAELATTPQGTKAMSVEVQNAQGHGFDQVVLRIGPDGTAKVSIIEVKNYSGQVSQAEMTAVRDNIQTNLDTLANKVATEYEGLGLTPRERDAVLGAISQGQIEIVPRIGERTRLASKADGSVLSELETHLQQKLGPNVHVSDPQRIPPEFFNPPPQKGAPKTASQTTAPESDVTAAGPAAQPTPTVEYQRPPIRPAVAAVQQHNSSSNSSNNPLPPPPATLQQIQQLEDQIGAILQARARADATAAVMGEEQASAQSKVAPIKGMVQQGQRAVSAAQAHQKLVTARNAANQEQQQRQQRAQGLIGGYPARAAGLAAIKVPLRAFQGFTWIAGKLPGNAGAAMRRMNNDANRMNAAFNQMDQSMARQAQTQPQQAQRLRTNANRLTTAQTQADTSRSHLETSARGGQSLQQANQTSLQQASAARQQAEGETATLDGMAQTQQAKKKSLAEQLRTWAVTHRQARLGSSSER